MTDKQEKILVGAFALSLLPIWRSGLREGMDLWTWILNHTVFGPPSEYITPKYYLPDQPVPKV